MAQPLIAICIDVVLRAKWSLVENVFGALINDRALVPAEWLPLLFVFEEILAHFRPDGFEQEAQMRRDRIVAQYGVSGLQQIDSTQDRQRAEDGNKNREIRNEVRLDQGQGDEDRGRNNRCRVENEPQ